jgi:hypothetical protein
VDSEPITHHSIAQVEAIHLHVGRRLRSEIDDQWMRVDLAVSARLERTKQGIGTSGNSPNRPATCPTSTWERAVRRLLS